MSILGNLVTFRPIMMGPYVVIIILNNNRHDDILAHLTSLRQGIYKNHSIIVLDNVSHNGSVEAIRASFPEVQVIELTENRGYAGNNNIGLRARLAQQVDWVFVLDDDTIVAPDCLAQLVEVGESNPQIGRLGLRFHYYSALWVSVLCRQAHDGSL